MSILFQHSSELAIRAMMFLAQQSPGKLSPVHEIADHAGVSEAYLAKITQRLASAGLVRSFRGPGKGMELGRTAQAITLASVVHAVQGPLDSGDCVLGAGMCTGENPCVLHREWLPLRTAIQDMLEKTTLADLVESLRQSGAAPEGNGLVRIPLDGDSDEKRRQQ
ncbi:MAG: Rrf2 family transcriptional regulator [Acidobacteria bacterium]|nr:Rrf2 family transcriptional regulator [Acidobacteriota bacterium]